MKEAEMKKQAEARRQQAELDRKLYELKKDEGPTEDKLTLKMGDKMVSVNGLSEQDTESLFLQTDAEPK